MGIPQTPNPPHLYPQALQIKLYQAFIFSIPILFSIILFLLFYLFYLKRRASSLSSSPTLILSSTFNPPPSQYDSSVGLKGDAIDNLPKIVFDEELKSRESLCCVCLGEFEIKEELIEVPSCKHMFHGECIHNWLNANSTCPLCRCSVIPTTTSAAKLQQQQLDHHIIVPMAQNHDLREENGVTSNGESAVIIHIQSQNS